MVKYLEISFIYGWKGVMVVFLKSFGNLISFDVYLIDIYIKFNLIRHSENLFMVIDLWKWSYTQKYSLIL